jgi:thioester reductase-like protein
MNSIVDYLEHWAAAQPGGLLSAFLDIEGHETESYTYLELHQRTLYLAERLYRGHGLKHGERALLVYPPGLEIAAAFFACARLGAIPVPVCPPTSIGFEASLAKLAFVARDCQAATALTTDAFYRLYRRLRDERRISSPRLAAPEPPHLEWIGTDGMRGPAPDGFRNDPNPILFLQYTSGSTTDPKGVVVSHENVIHNGQSVAGQGAIGVSWLPHYHDMGLIGYHLHPVVTGSATYCFSHLDFLKRPLLWLQTMSRVRATHASSPNFGFEYCLREDKVPEAQLDGLDLSSMRVLMNAAEPVRADTCQRFRERFALYGLRPQAVVAAYGLAENTLAATDYGRRVVAVDRRLLQRGALRIEDGRTENASQLRLASCGKPLDGIRVRIVDSESRTALSEKRIGEIWLAGKSVCRGYWNRPESTCETFGNTIANDPDDAHAYLRTGDLGFLHEDELYVCGRIKDLIIINGVNYHPQDIETIVEASSRKVRAGGVAIFNGDQERETLVVIAEVKTANDLPDPEEIAHAIRTECYVEPHAIVFVARGTIARTTSGKIARGPTRLRWLSGGLPAIATHLSIERKESARSPRPRARFEHILERYRLTGSEDCTFAEVGIDSLTLVMLLEGIELLLKDHGAADLANQVDVWLIQQLTVAEFFTLLDRLETASAGGDAAMRPFLERLKLDRESSERDSMRSDAQLKTPNRVEVSRSGKPLADVLLTGATGFFGPFLLSSLLRRTTCTYYALVRATDSAHGMERIRASLARARVWTPSLDEELERRVRVVCGDIAQPKLGLCPEQWRSLSASVQAVVHNAALVNYMLSYRALRPHNVDGVRELLRFSYAGAPKEFHLISSTFIFGWTAGDAILETDNNEDMADLDFGYAQSKWVAEQLTFAAARQGLAIRVYRPAFLSPSTGGVGSRSDIALLLLAFMIRHGIAVNALNQISFLPADIAADNIAAVFRQQQAAGPTLHVTVDGYYNMMDITRLIARDYGYRFAYYNIQDFVAEVNRQCGKDDPLYPLLPFISRSHSKVARMQNKRYCNDRYREARRQAGYCMGDPALTDTVAYLMTYLLGEGLIPDPVGASEAPEGVPL